MSCLLGKESDSHLTPPSVTETPQYLVQSKTTRAIKGVKPHFNGCCLNRLSTGCSMLNGKITDLHRLARGCSCPHDEFLQTRSKQPVPRRVTRCRRFHLCGAEAFPPSWHCRGATRRRARKGDFFSVYPGHWMEVAARAGHQGELTGETRRLVRCVFRRARAESGGRRLSSRAARGWALLSSSPREDRNRREATEKTSAGTRQTLRASRSPVSI